jgi:hypothetical protein
MMLIPEKGFPMMPMPAITDLFSSCFWKASRYGLPMPEAVPR